MSLEHLTSVLARAVDDTAFAAELATDEALLTGYDLTDEQRRAFLQGDVAALREMGVEERLTDGVQVIQRR